MLYKLGSAYRKIILPKLKKSPFNPPFPKGEIFKVCFSIHKTQIEYDAKFYISMNYT
jgi:hypothetical protein